MRIRAKCKIFEWKLFISIPAHNEIKDILNIYILFILARNKKITFYENGKLHPALEYIECVIIISWKSSKSFPNNFYSKFWSVFIYAYLWCNLNFLFVQSFLSWCFLSLPLMLAILQLYNFFISTSMKLNAYKPFYLQNC